VVAEGYFFWVPLFEVILLIPTIIIDIPIIFLVCSLQEVVAVGCFLLVEGE
jgi:hypothetical protein